MDQLPTLDRSKSLDARSPNPAGAKFLLNFALEPRKLLKTNKFTLKDNPGITQEYPVLTQENPGNSLLEPS
jgi:hypothetical protein